MSQIQVVKKREVSDLTQGKGLYFVAELYATNGSLSV